MRRIKLIMAGWLLTVTGVVWVAGPGLAQTSQYQGTYITTATVNVRKGPGTHYEIVAKVPKGTKVQVVAKEGRWLKVHSKHSNPPGYIDERFAVLGRETTASSGAYLPGTYMTTATVNVRKGPATSHAIIAKIPKNTKVQVVGAEGNWLKVQSKHGNPPGYIQKAYAKRLSES